MNNIFTNKKIYEMLGKSKGPAEMDPMYNGTPGVQQEDFEQFGAPKSTGPAKTRAEIRLEKTKMKAKKAKDSANKANDGSTNASKEKMDITKAKADRLARRQKRQEGRAERKNIRKKAKEGKIIDGKSGEYNAMSKKEKIKASREKQKSKDPIVEKKKPNVSKKEKPNPKFLEVDIDGVKSSTNITTKIKGKSTMGEKKKI